MTGSGHEYANALLVMLHVLEETLVEHIQHFERKSGMRVHAIKIFPDEVKDGKRICKAVEVVAQLK